MGTDTWTPPRIRPQEATLASLMNGLRPACWSFEATDSASCNDEHAAMMVILRRIKTELDSGDYLRLFDNPSLETQDLGHETKRVEPVVGFEPTTDGLQNRCSTTELNWRARCR